MIHISGMQKNVLQENKKLEMWLVKCRFKVVAGVLIGLENCKE